MKLSEPKRSYTMKARAEATEATGEAILDAATADFSSRRFDEVTLQGIAAAAGVTVQTVIRRFGSKDRLFDAVAVRERERIAAQREVPPGTDIREAVEILVEHYERDGRTVLHLLAEEDRSPKAAEAVQDGRAVHRSWVETHLAKLFDGTSRTARRGLVDAAVAATDLYTWKLLRLDMGRSSKEVIEVMVELLEGRLAR